MTKFYLPGEQVLKSVSTKVSLHETKMIKTNNPNANIGILDIVLKDIVEMPSFATHPNFSNCL